jgi:hypothetical protein
MDPQVDLRKDPLKHSTGGFEDLLNVFIFLKMGLDT